MLKWLHSWARFCLIILKLEQQWVKSLCWGATWSRMVRTKSEIFEKWVGSMRGCQKTFDEISVLKQLFETEKWIPPFSSVHLSFEFRGWKISTHTHFTLAKLQTHSHTHRHPHAHTPAHLHTHTHTHTHVRTWAFAPFKSFLFAHSHNAIIILKRNSLLSFAEESDELCLFWFWN